MASYKNFKLFLFMMLANKNIHVHIYILFVAGGITYKNVHMQQKRKKQMNLFVSVAIHVPRECHEWNMDLHDAMLSESDLFLLSFFKYFWNRLPVGLGGGQIRVYFAEKANNCL